MCFDTFIDKPKPIDGKDAIVAFGNNSSPNFFLYKCHFPSGNRSKHTTHYRGMGSSLPKLINLDSFSGQKRKGESGDQRDVED